MKKIALIVVLIIPILYPYKTFAQNDFPLITIPAKAVSRNQLQLLNESSPQSSLSQLNKNLIKRLSASYERLYKIAARIATRLEKMGKSQDKTTGIQMTQYTVSYNKIVEQLPQMKVDIKDTEEKLLFLENSENPKDQYPSIRGQIAANIESLNGILKDETDLVTAMINISSNSANNK